MKNYVNFDNINPNTMWRKEIDPCKISKSTKYNSQRYVDKTPTLSLKAAVAKLDCMKPRFERICEILAIDISSGKIDRSDFSKVDKYLETI
jgi:hypothetical protein